MKKILSILMIAILLVPCALAHGDSSAAASSGAGVSRVTGLGIMRGDEKGDFRFEDEVTRAEFCTLIARIRRLDPITANDQSAIFSDVPSKHWASGAVWMMYGLGFINGMGDGTFRPDDNITFNQAVKMLVAALGYDAAADEAGGYPLGHLVTAASIGLLKNLGAADVPVTRLTAARMLSNALDVVPLQRRLGTDAYEKNSGNATLYELFALGGDLIKVKGVLTAVGNMSLEDKFDAKLKKGCIKIDDIGNKSIYEAYHGLTYRAAGDYSEYLGYYVSGYARYDEKENIYDIMSLQPVDNAGYNEITVTDAENGALTGGYFEYDSGGARHSRVNLAYNVTYVYNGRVLADPTDEEKNIYYGEYRVIDNDGDGRADIVWIDEAQSFVVERTRIGDESNAVYFANKRVLLGRNSFVFDLADDGKVYEITGADKNALAFEDIGEGMGITFFISLDESYVRAVVSDETVSGRVDSVWHDGGRATLMIGGAQYKLAPGLDGLSAADVAPGDEGTFVLDCYGSIADLYGDKTASYSYAYVIAAGTSRGLDTTVQLRVVSGAEPVREERVVSGSTNITYYFQNDYIKTLACDKKVKFMAQMLAGSPAQVDVLLPFEQVRLDPAVLEGTLIGYTQNADGLVNEIYVFPLPADNASGFGESGFNARNLSFGGTGIAGRQQRGYLTGGKTMFICVPNVVRSEEDFYVQIRMADQSEGHNVYGAKTVFAPVPADLTDADRLPLLNAQPVDVLVIKKDMNATDPPNIAPGADVCIVGKIALALGAGPDEGSSVYRLELLSRDKTVVEYTASSGAGFGEVEKLLPGDLVQYNKDSFGRIARIKRVGRIQGLDAYHAGFNTVYGEAVRIEFNTFHYFDNIMVDDLTLYLGEDGTAALPIPVESAPPVYLYDRSGNGRITPSSTEDIYASGRSGAGGSKIYAYLDENNKPAALVIIK